MNEYNAIVQEYNFKINLKSITSALVKRFRRRVILLHTSYSILVIILFLTIPNIITLTFIVVMLLLIMSYTMLLCYKASRFIVMLGSSRRERSELCKFVYTWHASLSFLSFEVIGYHELCKIRIHFNKVLHIETS